MSQIRTAAFDFVAFSNDINSGRAVAWPQNVSYVSSWRCHKKFRWKEFAKRRTGRHICRGFKVGAFRVLQFNHQQSMTENFYGNSGDSHHR